MAKLIKQQAPIKKGLQGGAKIDSILNAPLNKNLNFVKRLYQKNTPSIMVKGEKSPSTHLMESSDGMAYPRVVQNKSGKLVNLGDKARSYAVKTKQYIKLKDDNEATFFGENYKLGKGVLKESKNKR
jgi:hypothetical protein